MNPKLIVCIVVALTALFVNPTGSADAVNKIFESIGIFTSTLGK